jgi:AcrR family transcriptional regulator
MDAAELVFGEKGYHGASLREIMIQAGVNIAAVNYYFGSKGDLLRAVIQRRSNEINEKRVRLLAAARARNGGLTLEAWLDAFLSPFDEAQRSRDPQLKAFLQLLNWTAATSDPFGRRAVRECFDALRSDFLDALRSVLPPDISKEDLYWRYRCVLAVMRWCIAVDQTQLSTTIGSLGPIEPRNMREHILAFLAAGLRAPSINIESRAAAE